MYIHACIYLSLKLRLVLNEIMRCKAGSLVVLAPDCRSLSRMCHGFKRYRWSILGDTTIYISYGWFKFLHDMITCLSRAHRLSRVFHFNWAWKIHIYIYICILLLGFSRLYFFWSFPLSPAVPRSRHTSGRTSITPYGNRGYLFVQTGNCLTGRTVLMALVASWCGLRWLIEQPDGSFLPELPRFQRLFGVVKANSKLNMFKCFKWFFSTLSLWCLFNVPPGVGFLIMCLHGHIRGTEPETTPASFQRSNTLADA